MLLSKIERLMLANQYKILEHLHTDDASEYRKLRHIFEEGYEGEYNSYDLGITDEIVTQDKSNFVHDVMGMYAALQLAYSKLDDTSGIDEEALVFPGFDGNHEGEYLSYADFLVHWDDKYNDVQLAHDDLNSHSRTVEMYTRMLEIWQPLSSSLHHRDVGTMHLSKEELSAILAAQAYPTT